MKAETVALAVSRFKSIMIECNNTCMTLSSKLDDGKIHTLYIEYQLIQGVEVVEE